MAFPLRSATNWCHDFPKLARESGFRFNRHGNNVHVDWKCISSIDIDRVIRERDLSAIDDNINNIVDCCLESEYDVKILDPNFVKLFRLAQLAIEYLLYCKRYLDHSVVILKDELRSKIEENAKLNKQVSANEEIIKDLKDRLKDKNRSIESKLSDSHGEIHKCPHCPKTFISSVFMNAHLNRRHSSSHNLSQLRSSSPIIDERYRAEAEKLHNEIKTLKERLNLTERLIRKASDKQLLSSDNVSTSKNDRKQEYPNSFENDNNDKTESQLESNVEQESRRRYQEEIRTFKDTLFSEIRQQNLKLANSLSFARDETDDFGTGNAKELIRQQEQEIQHLRDQLYKRLTPDIEDIQVKLNNQEDLWQKKIENIEKRHRDDIEKLYTQLKITRESADQMRNDYISKINDLERESQERRTKSIHVPDSNVKSEGTFFPSERHESTTVPSISDDHDDSENDNIPLPVRSQQKNNFIANKSDFAKEEDISNQVQDESEPNDRNKKRKRKLWVQSSFTFPRESQKIRTNGSNKNHSSSPFKTNFKAVNSREKSAPKSSEAEKTEKHQVREAFATIKSVAQQSPIRVQQVPIRRNKSVIEKLKSDDSLSESEAELAEVHRVNKSFATVEIIAQQSPMHRTVANLPIRRNKSVIEKLKSDDSESKSEAESAEDHKVNKSFATIKNIPQQSPIRRSSTNVSHRKNKLVKEKLKTDDSATESEAESTENRPEKEKLATIKNVAQQSSMYRSTTKLSDRKKKSVKNKMKSDESASESEASSSISSSSSSESWSESESPEVPEALVNSDRESNEKNRKSRIEVKSNNRDEPLDQERTNDNYIYARRRNSNGFENKDMIEELNSKLRDLGVDPEWQGIPKATLKQIMETVRHHRNLSSKKYRNLDKIRRELFEQVNQKLPSETKIDRSVEAPNTETSMDRFLKNVKGGKAWKALSLLDKNDGSHKSANNRKGTRWRSSDQIEKSPKRNVPKNSNEIIENEHSQRRSLRLRSPREPTNCEKSDESQTSKRIITRVVGNNNSSSRKSLQSAGEISEYRPSDKDLSHSYESLRSFRRYKSANDNQRQQNAVWEGKVDALETLVTSSPLRNKEIENIAALTRQVRESSFNFKNDASTIKTQAEEEDEEFSKSPRDRIININRSVIKSATRGSTASLVKKKVLFDLENTEKGNAPSLEEKDFYGKTTKDSGESDCEISSINEEINYKEDIRDDKQSGTVVLKTLQSEKIAEISKKIEQQLSVARRKPVGSVEAMFADKKSISENDKKFDILETQNRQIGATSSGKNVRKTDNEKYGSKDSNLDKDIDELLEIE